jgi:predicted nuclease of predicted toxin-antitoxin system
MLDEGIGEVQEESFPDLPELEERREDEDDIDDEREDDDQDEKETADFLGDAGESAIKELYDILEQESSDSGTEPTVHRPPLRRSERTTAGVKVRDDSYDWSFMNLSVAAALNEFGQVAKDACKNELVQLFTEKQALVPVKWENLNTTQRKKVVRSHMFLREKYKDGNFVKMKARLVADGRIQDRNVYNDYSSSTTKTQSVMMYLKLAAVKGWDLMKLDVGGAFLCADMDDTEEVYMMLDKQLSGMCADWIPEAKECLRDDGKLVVKVNHAMYGLIQSAKLWYKDLSGYLVSKGFKIVKGDDCVLVKRMQNGKYVVVILYVDDILVLSELSEDRKWVRSILVDKYDKVTCEEVERLPYLGMTIVKRSFGYELCMRSYIEEVIKFYGKEKLREYIIPATNNFFQVDESSEMLSEKSKFHSVMAKLLYLGKRGRPDILMPVQFLCTRVQAPTKQDVIKLERVLGYLQFSKSWTRSFDRSKFDRVVTYVDASFAVHSDGRVNLRVWSCLVIH